MLEVKTFCFTSMSVVCETNMTQVFLHSEDVCCKFRYMSNVCLFCRNNGCGENEQVAHRCRGACYCW